LLTALAGLLILLPRVLSWLVIALLTTVARLLALLSRLVSRGAALLRLVLICHFDFPWAGSPKDQVQIDRLCSVLN
jgi:hypothetical protein